MRKGHAPGGVYIPHFDQISVKFYLWGSYLTAVWPLAKGHALF